MLCSMMTMPLSKVIPRITNNSLSLKNRPLFQGCSFFVNKRNFTTSMDDIKKGKHFEIAEGLLDYTNHRIKELEDGDDYVLKQGLTCHLEQIKRSLADMQELQTIMDDPQQDSEMLTMATNDLETIYNSCSQLVSKLKELVTPQETYDAEDAVIEVVPGVGGLEACMFAEEMFNLYIKYMTNLGFSVANVEIHESTVGLKQSKFSSTSGITEASAEISGYNVFGKLKFESGVHRVQRVPVTGSKNDRLQTSTCSVAILPKQRDVTCSIDEKDLKFEYMRAGGAGGQHVNTTDSACRVTHIPTGLFVKSQEERSQLQNKKIALKKLQNILYQMEFNEMMSNLHQSRKLQIGNMNRNEKIRTYNFNRHSISEHRLKITKTVSNMNTFLSGDYGFEILEEFHSSLSQLDQEERLADILRSHQNNS